MKIEMPSMSTQSYQNYAKLLPKPFFIDLSTLYHAFTFLVFAIICLIVLLHIISRFVRPKPLKLEAESTVLIVGGCMGIGR